MWFKEVTRKGVFPHFHTRHECEGYSLKCYTVKYEKKPIGLDILNPINICPRYRIHFPEFADHFPPFPAFLENKGCWVLSGHLKDRKPSHGRGMLAHPAHAHGPRDPDGLMTSPTCETLHNKTAIGLLL